MSDYLTMGQAAKLMRIGEGVAAAKRARRLLIVRQKSCRQKLIWFRGTGRHARAYTTEATLRRNLPELFDKTEDVVAHLRAFLREIKQDVSGLRNEVEEMRASNSVLAAAYKRRFGAGLLPLLPLLPSKAPCGIGHRVQAHRVRLSRTKTPGPEQRFAGAQGRALRVRTRGAALDTTDWTGAEPTLPRRRGDGPLFRRETRAPMASPVFDRARAVRVLLDAAAVGDSAACKRHGISERTLQRYRERVGADPELTAVVAEKKNAEEAGWSASRRRFLRSAIAKLEAMIAEAGPDQIREVAGAIKIVGELEVVVVNMIGAGTDGEQPGPSGPPSGPQSNAGAVPTGPSGGGAPSVH